MFSLPSSLAWITLSLHLHEVCTICFKIFQVLLSKLLRILNSLFSTFRRLTSTALAFFDSFIICQKSFEDKYFRLNSFPGFGGMGEIFDAKKILRQRLKSRWLCNLPPEAFEASAEYELWFGSNDTYGAKTIRPPTSCPPARCPLTRCPLTINPPTTYRLA